MIHHKGLFEKYKKDKNIFVETGTFCGLGVQLALDAGYSYILSVELDAKLYKRAMNIFKNELKVKLYQGTSENCLWEMIKDIKEEIVFWLDAHDSNTGCVGPEKSPIIKELFIINNHFVKTHTIIIDDVRNMGTEHFGMITKDEVLQKIMEINPNYKITYENGSMNDEDVFYQDILVAHLD